MTIPTARDALQAIADLPTPDNLERMAGHEDAYRAVEKLFGTATPYVAVKMPPQIEVGDLKDQRASLIARGIDPNLDHLPHPFERDRNDRR